MEPFELAHRMKRLTAWLDRASQPDGFILECHDRAPLGDCIVTVDPDRQGPYASGNRNRVHLCGAGPGLRPEGIAQLIARFGEAGVQRFFVWLSPGPDMDNVRGWLAEMGFTSKMRWTRYPTLVRESLLPSAFDTRLTVREVSATEVAAAKAVLGDTMWDEFLRTAGKEGFFHFMAFDAGRPVATGALGVFEGLGHLHNAATAESDRKRGAQSALIAARIAKARALGCTALVVETLTMLEHSMRNLERAGFRVAFEKEVYEWTAPNA